jgi:hypothetical protein
MKNFTAQVRMMDGTLEAVKLDAESLFSVETAVMEQLFKEGKHPNRIEHMGLTPPMKDACFVVNRAANDFVILDDALWNNVEGVYRGRFGAKTLEQYKLDPAYNIAELMEWDDAQKLYDKAQSAKYCGPVKEIDEDRYNYLLEVLPPEDWVYGGAESSFKLCERLSGNITTIAARIGGKHYEFNDDYKMPHAAIVAKVGKAIEDGTLIKLEA